MAKKRTKKTFTVDRALWLTGREVDAGAVSESLLRDEATGLMCCLGHVCRQLGISERQITGKGAPSDIGSERARREAENVLTTVVDDAMEINDSSECHERQREAKLRRLFMDHGLTLKFKGHRLPKTKLAQMAKAAGRV